MATKQFESHFLSNNGFAMIEFVWDPIQKYGIKVFKLIDPICFVGFWNSRE